MTTLQQKMAGLPASRRAGIKARAADLVAEENALRQLRNAHAKTQSNLAQELGIGQDSISRLEKRSDMLISTLRDYITALGGTMRLLVEFKDRPAVELKSLGVLTKKGTTRIAGRKAAGRRIRKGTKAA